MKREQQSQKSVEDKVAAGIVHRCIQLQLRWAHFMHRKTEHLSSTAKKTCLLLFCTLFLGCSLYSLIKSFGGKGEMDPLVTPIHVQVHAVETGEEDMYALRHITKAEVQRIERFKGYMDSLRKTDRGKKRRDSILLVRPGLMDSIQIVEKLYQLQSSQK